MGHITPQADPPDIYLCHMHLEGALLGEDFATLLAHEANVVSSQIMIVELQLECERIVANAAFKRRIAAMIRRYVMILRVGRN